MADITGIINGTTSNSKIKARIVWEETVDILGNTGVVKAKLQLRTTLGYVTSSSNGDFTITINGNEKSVLRTPSSVGPSDAWKTVFEHTGVTVAHTIDGSKTINISASGRFQGTSISSITVGGTAQLYNIPRASDFTPTPSVEVNGTNAVTVSITRKRSDYTHQVDIYTGSSYNNSTYRMRYTNIGTSVSYAIPTSWRLAMPTSMQGTARVTVTTFSGATQVGDPVTKTFTIHVPSFVKPILRVNQAGGNVTTSAGQPAGMSGFTKYIQGHSRVKAAFSGSAGDFGSEVAISARYIKIGGARFDGNPAQSGILNAEGSVSVVIGVTDARGQTTETTIAVSFERYTPPSIVSAGAGEFAWRALTSGIADDLGTYIAVKVRAIFSSCGGENSISVLRCRYKSAGSGTWGAWNSLTNNTQLVIGGGAVLTTQSYDVQAYVEDAVQAAVGGAGATISARISTADVAFHLRDGGKGGGLGKYGEADGRLDSAWEIRAPKFTREGAPFGNLMHFGANPNVVDTVENWTAMGIGVAWITNASLLTNQPTQYAFLLNIVRDDFTEECHQLLLQQATGNIYHRGGNASGWNAWRTVWDSGSVVPVANGGTGATTAAGIRNAIGLGNTTGKLGSAYIDIDALITALHGSWTNATLESGVTSPGTHGGGRLRYRKMGARVYVAGGVNVAFSGTAKKLTTLPHKPPTNNVYFINATSGANVARLYVNTSGELYLEWVRKLSDGTNETSFNAWVDCNLEFWTD